MKTGSTVLLVGNWDSGVGYAWWLMESFWVVLAERYASTERALLAYPIVSTLSPRITAAPLEVVEFDMRTGGVRALLKQFRFLNKNRVRLAYFSDWGTWRWRYLVYRAAGVKKIIVHDHTPGVRIPPKGIKRLLKLILNRLPGISADGAIGATEFVRQRIVEVTCFPPERAFSAPNGLPLPGKEAAQPGEGNICRDEWAIPNDRKILVMTSRANRYKGVDFAISCVAKLVAAGRKDLHFLFVGDGPDLAFFKQTADLLAVSEFCTFPGSRNDVDAILGCCNFAIHPSKGEVGYSLSVLEYMRAGLPVIVPNNPSVCEATADGETGLLYSEGDVESGTDCIRKLLDDPADTRRIGQRAREQVLANYQLQHTHRALLHAFAQLDPARRGTS